MNDIRLVRSPALLPSDHRLIRLVEFYWERCVKRVTTKSNNVLLGKKKKKKESQEATWVTITIALTEKDNCSSESAHRGQLRREDVWQGRGCWTSAHQEVTKV